MSKTLADSLEELGEAFRNLQRAIGAEGLVKKLDNWLDRTWLGKKIMENKRKKGR